MFLAKDLIFAPRKATGGTVAFDAVSTAGSGATSAACTMTASGSSTVYAFITIDRNPSITGVTYGSSNMTLLTSFTNNNVASSAGLWIYKLANPPTGSQTITVNFGGGVHAGIGAVSYTGVTSETTSTAFGSSATASIGPVSPVSSGVVIAGLNNGSRTYTSESGGNSRLLVPASGGSGEVWIADTSTASTTFSAALSSSAWCAIAVSLHP